MAYANWDRDYILIIDASDNSIDHILSQIGDDGLEHAISYGGRSLRNSEKFWTVTEKECLALIEGVRENYQYLYNKEFTVITDHISLKYLQSLKASKGRLFRWSIALQNMKFKVKFRAGRTNTNADGLSRREYPEVEEKGT